MKRKRIKEVRNVNAHIALLLVFALLALIPFIPNEITGSSIIFFNDSDSNTTETSTQAIIQEENITSEVIATFVNITDYLCTFDGTNFTVCETIEWSNGSYAKGFISGTIPLAQVEKQYNSTFTYCETTDKEGTKALHAYVYDENDKQLAKQVDKDVRCEKVEELNITIENLTESNITIEQNIIEPLENATETKEPVQNVTQPEANVTESITIPEVNISVENATVVEEKVVQYQAIIGQPVKWKKTIKLDQESSNLEIELPKDVEITSVQKIENNQSIDITSDVVVPASNNLLTGFAVLEEPDATSLIIDQPVSEIEIEYETEAPQVFEEQVNGIKRVTVSSNTHYENILTYTSINEVAQNNIRLYWIVNGSRVSHQITAYNDTNNNSLIDEIYWITPHLSNQTFEIDITILNVQSFPRVEGNWTVRFNTTGTANLTITPINGTTYGTADPDDLQFLELTCGNTILSPTFDGTSVFYPNYNCNFTGNHTAKVLTQGSHTLKFEFGNETAYAFNLAGICGGGTPCDCGDVVVSNVTLGGPDPVVGGAACPGAGLIINTSGIEVNCGGNKIRGSNGSIGINFSRDTNRSTITNCELEDFDAGIHLEYNATMNYIINNNISYMDIVGINVTHEANDTNLTNNHVFRIRGDGIYISGYNVSSIADTVHNNTLNAYHVYNTSGVFIKSPFANESARENGILFEFVNSSNLTDIAARNNNMSGIRILNSSNNNIIELGSYEYNALIGARNEFAGIEIDDNSRNNIIRNNTIQHNRRGLTIGKTREALNNTFLGNAFNNNTFANIIINNSLNNTFRQETWNVTVILANSSTDVNFTSNITFVSSVRLSDVIDIRNNSISINTSNSSIFNTTANIMFKITTLNDGAVPLVTTGSGNSVRKCNPAECNVLENAVGRFIFNVSHFTNYTMGANNVSTITRVDINTTNPATNDTDVNITIYIRNATDADQERPENISNWYVGGNTVAILNFPFETNSTNTTANFVRNYGAGNNGTIVGNIKWTNSTGCIRGGCYRFAGNNDANYINVTNSNDLNFSSNSTFSVALWFNASDVGTGNGALISHTDGSNTNLWTLYYPELTNRVVLDIRGNTSGQQIAELASSDNSAPGNRTHFVVAIFRRINTTSTGFELWLNGVQKDNQSSSGNISALTKMDTLIGDSLHSGFSGFNGTIDEVLWFNRSLNQAQILELNRSNGTWETIVAQETSVNDVWSACVTPNEQISDGNTTCTTQNVTILEEQCANITESTTLINNVTATGTCFTLNADNIVLDCAGYGITYGTVTAGNAVTGDNRTNVTVQNCFIEDNSSTNAFGIGINFTRTNLSVIYNNTIYTNGTNDNYGIQLATRFYTNRIENNTIITTGTSDNYGIMLTSTGAQATLTNITGNRIVTNGTIDSYGITIQGDESQQIIIRNNVTTKGTGAGNYGIYLTARVTSSNITENTVNTSGTSTNYGIFLATAINNTIVSNNTIYSGGSTSSNAGIIAATRSFGNNITHNRILARGTQDNYGIRFSACHICTAEYNNATTNGTTTGNAGIILDTTIDRSNVTNNVIVTNGSTTNYGIYIVTDANNSNIDGNNITTTGSGGSNFGIYVFTRSIGNNITNNQINTSGTSSNHGINLDASVNETILLNNTINSGGSGSTNIGVRVAAKTYRNNVTHNRVLARGTNDNYGINLRNNGDFNTVESNNVTTNGTTSNYGIYLLTSMMNNVTGNVVVTNGSSGNSGVILQTDSNTSIVDNNNITTTGSSTTNHGIQLTTRVTSSNVTNNIINTSGAGQNNGIQINAGTNSTLVLNNSISMGGSTSNNVGVYVTAKSFFNNVTHNRINGKGGTSANYGIWLQNNADIEVIEYNNISTNGTTTTNYGILSETSTGNNLSWNVISVNGTRTNHGILLQLDANSTILDNNNITTSGTQANNYAVYIDNANDSVINNTGLSDPLQWIFMNAGTNVSFINTSFRNINGTINFPNLFTLNGTRNITLDLLNTTYNRSFVNSSNLTFLNTSATIRLYVPGLEATPRMLLDTEDDTTYRGCPSSRCTFTSYANSVLTFTVTSWSSHAGANNTAPVLARVDINSTDPTTNDTNQNITIYPRSVNDTEADYVKNITTWYRNGNSLIALNMPFEGGSNSTFTRDYSAFNGSNNSGIYNGSVTGATFSSSAGVDGRGAYNFSNASTQYINLSDAADLISNFTITAWIRTGNTASGQKIFMRRTNAQQQYDFGMQASGVLSFYNGSVTRTSTGNLSDNSWHFISVSINDTHLQFYIDGASVGVNTIQIVHRTVNTIIGAWFPSGGSINAPSIFNGTIDDLVVWNRTLTRQQIQALYQNRTDLIVAQETDGSNENWSACVTPNDGYTDGSTVCSENFTLSSSAAPTSINLLNPSNNMNNISNRHVFLANASDDTALVNATLFHNISGTFAANQTVTVTGTGNTSSFTVNLIPFGAYIWNVLWCDSHNQCAFASSNFTFTSSACGTLNSSYVFDINRTASTVIANTSCININANDLDLSCTNGATFIANQMRGVALNATGRTNITIKGCVVQGFNTSVFFSRTNYSLIDNNTFRNNSAAGVHLLLSSDYNIIQNNSIASLANGSSLILSALRLERSSNNNITNNTINNNASAAIQLITNSNNNSIVNNNVSSNGSAGILIDGLANFTLVENNTIFSNNSIALFSRSNSNNSFINNSATSTGVDAISIITSENNTILRNIGNSTVGNGFDGSTNLHNSTIGNNIFYGGPSDHVFVISGTSNVIFNNTMNSRVPSTNLFTLYLSGENNTIRNNTLTAVNGTGLYLSAAYTSNITGNLITSVLGDGVRIEFASNNSFNDNEIRTNSSFAIRILADPEVEGSRNNSFNNTILKTNNSWIETTNSSSHSNFSNTSFIMPRGRIVITSRITVGNLTNVTLANLNVTQNRSFLNSTAIPAFNTSAIIALNGITFPNPEPIIDTEDDGAYRRCLPPECNELSFASNIFTFNTTHFSSHSGNETNNGPNITLNNPPNATINISQQHRFNANMSDDINLANATLYHNISGSFIANQTINITGTLNSTNFSVTNILDGGYIWNVKVCDDANQCVFAPTNFTFTINNPPRDVYLINPPNNTLNNSNAHIFFSNASDDRQLANATLYHNINGTFAGNQTQTRNGTFNTSSFTIANIADGTYIWNVLWCDSDSNCSFSTNATGNFTFTVDATRPSNITLINPPNSISNDSTSHKFIANITENRALLNATLFHNINGSFVANQTVTLNGTNNETNFTISLIPTGTYIWNVLACDEANNCNQSNINFTFTVSSSGQAPSGGSNTPTGAAARTQTIIIPKPQPPKIPIFIPEDRINITRIIPRIPREVLARTINIQLPIKIKSIDWLLLLILASLLAIWVIKKEWQYLKEYRKATEKEHKIARASRLHLIKDLTSTILRSIRLVAVSIEDLLHVIKITLLALRRSKVKKARVLSLAKARYIRALEKSNRLLILKQKTEEKLLAFELARRERVARLESLVKHHISLKDRIKSIRTLLLKSASITEKQISNISESFKKSLPSMPELMPHPEVKIVSAYENDAREFTYLYNRIDQHIKENNLEAAKEAYNALILIFNKLINETSNKYELISSAKEIQSRLELAILSDRAREKIEGYKAKDTEIEIEKLPPAKKYSKSELISEEEIKIDYLKELLKKNEYKKAIELYKSINPDFNRQPIKTPVKIKPVKVEKIKPSRLLKEKDIKQSEDLRLSYLRELLKKNEYKEAIKLYENVYKEKRDLIKKPKKVEPVFLEDIEPIKYEKLSENPTESELNIDSLRRLLKKNDFRTARKIFDKVFSKK